MTDPHLTAVRSGLDRLPSRADAALADLAPAHFTAPPPGGGWSIGQVFEHLCVADASYLDQALPAALIRARARPAPRRPWRPSLLGGWLCRMLQRPDNRLPAPKPYRVGPVVRADVVTEWRRGLDRLRQLVQQAEGLDLRTPLRSPVAWWLRMNLGDALLLPVVHAERHLGQVERIRRALGG